MQYKVHSRHDTLVDVPAKTPDNHEIVGRMPASIVELVPVNGVGATITLTVVAPVKAEQEKVRDLYKVGALLELSIAPAKGKDQ